MGLIYSSSDSSQFIQALTDNLKSGHEAISQLKTGSQGVLSAVDGKTLSGSAYTAGKGLFRELVIPTITKVITAVDSVEQELQGYQSADQAISSEGYLDEENLNKQIDAKKAMKASVDAAATVANALAKSNPIAKIVDGLLNTQKNLANMSNNLQDDIEELEKKLEKLHQFSSETSGLFSNSLNDMKIAMQSVLVLNNTTINSDGSYSLPKGTDKSWFTSLKANSKKDSDSSSLVVTIDGKEYYLGNPKKPDVVFDNDFPYDPELEATWEDRRNRAKWEAMLRGAQLLGKLPDGTSAYSHYLYGGGEDYVVDFEKGYRQDRNIKTVVDREILSMQQAAEEYYRLTGQTNFSLTSSATVIPNEDYPATENWQKTLGGYQTWTSADISVKNGQIEMNVDVNVIDRYNFNKGQQDIATGAKDVENGRFESLGWANSFDVSGNLEREISWTSGNINSGVVSGGDSKGRIMEGEDR
ncbi:T7SS effector LXG polymorphic toxin [Enterococcus larvae]|uniref:T7SS effector LXG polymorphic toxin n=1 Tax=Enterococcus larvae TaxID=2794352 RepID=UPI003F30F1D5